MAQQPAGAAGAAGPAAASSASLADTMAALHAAVPDDSSARKLMFMAMLKDVMDNL